MKIRAPVKEYDPIRIERRINDFWVRTYAYTRDKNSRAKQKKYYFVDGPPFTAGSINIGMARNKILKDAHVRFIKSQGFNVLDRPGFDMHGLPIEVKVEETLGLKYKNEIEELGVEKFVKNCMEFAEAHRSTMTEQFRTLGIWLDWQNPYLTADTRYIESVWWSLKEAHRMKFLEKQKQVTGWCPRCESPLAPGEITYKPTEGHSVYFKIPIKGKRDEYIIVWTTTPWTFAGCLAIAVNPDLTYARVAIRQGGKKSTVIVLENRVEEIAAASGIDAYEIIDTVQGKSLEKLGFFHPLMADIQFHKTAEGDWCHKIIALDSVHDSHTGCVYISPGLGIADSEIGEKYSLPLFSPVDERGVFTTEVGMKYAGQSTEEANASILADMKALRFVLSSSKRDHKFGHCWRCDSSVISRATEQWFLKSEGVKEAMQKIVRGASWTPDNFGSKRQQEWISKGHDWCISRQRFWGTPLPVWECIVDICGHIEVVGSVRELEGANGYQEGMGLHRPWIDAVSLECPKCGGLMKRVPDIVDVWFDSGAASWAQLGYPRKKTQFKEMWPANWICESQDQFKGWFYNQIFSGAILFGKIPFRKVLAHGQITGESSGGMSEISTSTEIFGTDALRLYLLSIDPTEGASFNQSSIKRFHSTLRILWNCYAFSASYMNMDGWDPRENQFSKVKATLRQEDIWLISRAETLTHAVRKEMESMRTHNACKLIEDFIIEDLSRWYVKLSRERVWKEGLTPDKEAAFTVQREILTRLSVILSPFAPFMAETLYQEMDGTLLSVNMVQWPEPDGARLAEGMERSMNRARDIVRTAQKFRQELGLGLRWPIGKMTISAKSQAYTDAVNAFPEIIKSQTNVKELELVPENQEWAGQELIVVPNRNVIGKAYKQRLSKIARMLKVLPAKEIREKVEAGEYELGIEGEMIKILPDMVRFETKLPEGIESKEFSGGTIYFDTKMTDELMAEGFAREIIRRIQQMRKEAGLEPEEYINLRIKMDDALLELLDKWLEKIADSTRATQMEVVDDVSEEEYIVEWPIQEETVVIGITSLNIRKAMGEFLGQKDIDNELALSIVEAGILTSLDFLLADREEVLKIPGMNHSKYRKLKEYLELPEEKRQLADSMCPLCNGYVESGSTTCQRCGKDLIGGEELAVEIIRDIEAEEELEYVQEPVRERVKVGRKKHPEAPAEPEDEIVRMASDGPEKAADDEITSEILSSLSEDEIGEAPKASARQIIEQPAAEIPPPTHDDAFAPGEPQPREAEPGQDKILSELVSGKDRERTQPAEPETVPRRPEPEKGDFAPGQADDSFFLDAETPAQPHAQPPMPAKEPEVREPDESDIEDTFQRDLEDSEMLVSGGKREIIDEERDWAINEIAETFDIKNSAAKTLYNHGYTSIESLSKVNEEELREIKGIGKITARRIVQKATSGETKMCSICNAIVPITAQACNRCGERFVSGGRAQMQSDEENMAALEILDKKLIDKPSDAALLYSKAQTLRDGERYGEALDIVNLALRTSPDDRRLTELREALEADIEGPEDEMPKQETPAKRERSLTFAEARKLKDALDRSGRKPDAPKKETYEAPEESEPEIPDHQHPADKPDVPKKETYEAPEEPEPEIPDYQHPADKPDVMPEPVARARPQREDIADISPEELESESLEPAPEHGHRTEAGVKGSASPIRPTAEDEYFEEPESEVIEDDYGDKSEHEAQKTPATERKRSEKQDVSLHIRMDAHPTAGSRESIPEKYERHAEQETGRRDEVLPKGQSERQAHKEAGEAGASPAPPKYRAERETERLSEYEPRQTGGFDESDRDSEKARAAEPERGQPAQAAPESVRYIPGPAVIITDTKHEAPEPDSRTRAIPPEEGPERSAEQRARAAEQDGRESAIPVGTGAGEDAKEPAEPFSAEPRAKPAESDSGLSPKPEPYAAKERSPGAAPEAKHPAYADDDVQELTGSARPGPEEAEAAVREPVMPKRSVSEPEAHEQAKGRAEEPAEEYHAGKHRMPEPGFQEEPKDRIQRPGAEYPEPDETTEKEPARKYPAQAEIAEEEAPEVIPDESGFKPAEEEPVQHPSAAPHAPEVIPDEKEFKPAEEEPVQHPSAGPQAQEPRESRSRDYPERTDRQIDMREPYVQPQQTVIIQQEKSAEPIRETKPAETQPARQHDVYHPAPAEQQPARSTEVIRETRYVESVQPAQRETYRQPEQARAVPTVALGAGYSGSRPAQEPQMAAEKQAYTEPGLAPEPELAREEQPDEEPVIAPVIAASAGEEETAAIVPVNESLSTFHEEPVEIQALLVAARASEPGSEDEAWGVGEQIPDEIPTDGEAAGDLLPEEEMPEEATVDAELSGEAEPEEAVPDEFTPEEIPAEYASEDASEVESVPAQPESASLRSIVSEMVPTKEEEDMDGAYQNGDIKLKSSFTYLIPEERSARSYQLFKKAIGEGMPGYCVTRTFPEKIRERYELGTIPILWLSNVAKEDAVRPKDLEKLSLSLEEFLGSEGGIVLLDGIEYLITNNNFITVLKLIQSLRDQVAINRSILLLSINPSTMDTHQINLLRREVDSVIE